ncbi:MAG: Ppx/GppA family phosphatase [Acidobacteria bacterium]|nr:Ppx/GppA family phosphatase [Acidobacteriota bacterium]MCA1636801.1 Ppx/GppA family phosphatase [Acidobacteriota bacterium]
MKTQKLAAIDIGSNSLKLAIVEAAASDSFTIILQDRERVRLGHETLRNKFLSPEAINLSADAIAKFRSIAESRGVDSIIAVATASVREAQNAVEFVNEIERRTGVHIDVLSSIEEARIIGLAVAQFFNAENTSLINIDIGGGSTELSLMKNGEPDKLFSMKLGAVGLTEKFIFSNPPKEKELRNLKSEIVFALKHPLQKMKGATWEFATGTSGTILNLAALLNFQTAGNPSEKMEIPLKRLAALNKMMAKITLEARTKLPVISPQRAEVIVAGGQILEGVMRALEIQTLQPCAYALREGVIIDHLRQIEAESMPPVPDVEDKRLRDVFAIGRRYGYEETHALKVADLSEKIFDALAPIYNLKRHGRTLLSAAALLHDVGYHISHEAHHKHSFYLIKHSEMTGFTETEKLIIANIARYHRRALPKEKHLDFMQFNERDRKTIARLGGILRIADALDRGYENHVEDIKFRRDKDNLYLKLESREDYTIELQAIEQKKDLFEFAFNCNLIAL